MIYLILLCAFIAWSLWIDENKNESKGFIFILSNLLLIGFLTIGACVRSDIQAKSSLMKYSIKKAYSSYAQTVAECKDNRACVLDVMQELQEMKTDLKYYKTDVQAKQKSLAYKIFGFGIFIQGVKV